MIVEESMMRSLPQAIGPTENALRQLLTRQLSGSAIPGYVGWVCLNLAEPTASRADLETRLQQEVRCTPGEASTTVTSLIDRGLIGVDTRPTPSGLDELAATRRRVKATTARLVEGIPQEEQSRTIQVLDTVRRRAEQLLSS
jgi:hypothetical protein